MEHLTRDALNDSFGIELTNSLRLAIIKLLRKGIKDPTIPGKYRLGLGEIGGRT